MIKFKNSLMVSSAALLLFACGGTKNEGAATDSTTVNTELTSSTESSAASTDIDAFKKMIETNTYGDISWVSDNSNIIFQASGKVVFEGEVRGEWKIENGQMSYHTGDSKWIASTVKILPVNEETKARNIELNGVAYREMMGE